MLMPRSVVSGCHLHINDEFDEIINIESRGSLMQDLSSHDALGAAIARSMSAIRDIEDLTVVV